MKLQNILMADVINSRKYKSNAVANALAKIVEETNTIFEKMIISPLTITLGDEFQAVISTPEAIIKIILHIEEQLIINECPFKLRYASSIGKIETPLNKKIAYGMIGEGLTQTRTILNNAKKVDDRFFLFSGIKGDVLNKLFIVFGSFVDRWKIKDFKIIKLFFNDNDYKKVAAINNYTASAMWKKRKSLNIKEYNTIKQLILQYAAHDF
jgi:SatD family (SatD)